MFLGGSPLISVPRVCLVDRASFFSLVCEPRTRLACRLHDKHLEDLVHACNVESPLLQFACKNALAKCIGRNHAHLQNWSVCEIHCSKNDDNQEQNY